MNVILFLLLGLQLIAMPWRVQYVTRAARHPVVLARDG